MAQSWQVRNRNLVDGTHRLQVFIRCQQCQYATGFCVFCFMLTGGFADAFDEFCIICCGSGTLSTTQLVYVRDVAETQVEFMRTKLALDWGVVVSQSCQSFLMVNASVASFFEDSCRHLANLVASMFLIISIVRSAVVIGGGHILVKQVPQTRFKIHFFTH